MSLTVEQHATFILARTRGIGPKTFRALLNKYGSAEYTLAQQHQLNNKFTFPTPQSIKEELTAIANLGARIVCWGDDTYPELLTHTEDAPLVLTVWGDASLLSQPQVAFVGTRNASAAATQFTTELVKDVSASGYLITSGLARGIDTTAHQAALASNTPTIAVLAGGLGHIYPPQNIPLAEKISQNGCVVTEQPFTEQPTNRHFPRRNRIIAGLSLATVITEAGRHSGSLITAQYAGEYGRSVLAVPGNPADPRAAGGNHLIAQGATLLQDSTALLAALRHDQTLHQPRVHYTREKAIQPSLDFNIDTAPPPPAATEKPLQERDNDAELPTPDHISNLLSSTPVSLDELVQQSGISEVEVSVALTELELLGQIQRHPDGRLSKL